MKSKLKEYLKDRKSSNGKGTRDTGSGLKDNEDFKIALAVMVSAENFKVLEEQFLKNC